MNNRRDFLKASIVGAAGACAFGPNFNSFAASSGKQGAPKRVIFIKKSNGLPAKFYNLPTMSSELKRKENKNEPYELDLDKHKLPGWLESLSDYKENMTILKGLSANMCLRGHYGRHSVMGAFFSNGKLNTLKRTTVDFELAKLFPSPLGHVEVSFASDRKGVVPGYSAPAPFKTNYCYADPITAYNNMFQCILDPNALKLENKMLQHLAEFEEASSKGLKETHKRGIDNHISAIAGNRSKNDRLNAIASKIAAKMPDKDRIYSMGHVSRSLVERQDAMTEVVASALISGMTNVVTYTIDDLNTVQTGLPGLGSELVNLHRIGHGGGYADFDTNECRELIRLQHVKQIKTIADKLKAEPEGEGTMFDNTMIMYFPEAGEAHHGFGLPPFFFLSGKNCNLDIAGRYVRLPDWGQKGHQTLGNLWTTLLNAHGNPIPHYGNLDQKLFRMGIPQEGPIKQFLKA